MTTMQEFSEGTRKTITRAVKGRGNLPKYFKENMRKVTEPVLHYEITFDAMTEILLELESAGVDTKMIRHNLNEAGYYCKYNTFPRE